MAKKRRTASRAANITRIVKAPAPIIRVTAPRAVPARRRAGSRRKHRNHSSGGAFGGIISNESVQMAIGGALYGYAVKSGIVAKLPAIPVLGRTGTAAILLDYWARHGGGQLAHRAARAAAAIAGYQLGHEGSISGENLDVHDGQSNFNMGDATTPGSLAGDEDSY